MVIVHTLLMKQGPEQRRWTQAPHLEPLPLLVQEEVTTHHIELIKEAMAYSSNKHWHDDIE